MSNIILTSKYRDVIMEMSIEGWPMAWAIFMIAKNDLEPEDEDNE